MELRTKIKIEPSPFKIGYDDKVMFIGSCFAHEIGSQMKMGHMPVLINPAGTVYNPVSVSNTLNTIISGRKFTDDDLCTYNGSWFSFYHYTDFSSENPEKVLEKINNRSAEAAEFLKDAKFLFITFGTARVYIFKKSGLIVSNCHKMPADQFELKLLKIEDIVSLWSELLDKLHSLFPHLKIIFSISPVRHWKDGAHGNQVSKSTLFLAVERLLDHKVTPQYFPAYELVMDELRDYRFYGDDMLHPSRTTVNYIWEAFSGSFLENKTFNNWKEVVKITKACRHRINTNSPAKIREFASGMLKEISELEKLIPVDLTSEKRYFNDLLKVCSE